MTDGLPDTPCLVVDSPVLERNLRRLQQHCDRHGLRFRPHVKTHKSPAIAARQLELGAAGLAFQKLGEAESFDDELAADTMIAFNLLGERKLERLVALARRRTVSVTVDSLAVGSEIARACGAAGVDVGLWIDCDTGLGRTGVQDADEALALAARLCELRGVELRGLFTYPTPADGGWLREALDRWASIGLPEPEVSVGGTPEAHRTRPFGVPTELRAGTYAFMDLACVDAGAAELADCALTVHATCVSRPGPNRAVVDAGSKALGLDVVDLGAGAVFGVVRHRPELAVHAVYEEHGLLSSEDADGLPVIGERIEIIPAHVCYTVNLHDCLWVLADGELADRWPVAARGRSN